MNLQGSKIAAIALNFLVISSILLGGQTLLAQNSQYDDPGEHYLPKPFRKSVIIGVTAGFLIGLTTMTDFKKLSVSKNLDAQNLFRGMSYGLYGGILLGLWVTYGMDDENSGLELPPEYQNTNPDISIPQTLYKREPGPESGRLISVGPIVGDRGVEGVGVAITLLQL